MALLFSYLSLKKTASDNKRIFINSYRLKVISQVLCLIFLCGTKSSFATQIEHSKSDDKFFKLAVAIYPPYNYKDENGEIKGLNIEIITAALSSVGYQVNIELLPFGRALQYAKQGTVDGIALWYSEHRTQWFQFSEPFTNSESVFYKRKSLKVNYQTLSDISPFIVGTVQKYAYPENFSNNSKIKKDQVLNDEKNIKKLILGRIDLALIDKRMAQFILKKNHPEQIHLFDSAGTLKNENYYLAISKNTENYKQKIKVFNLGLANIKKNGILEKIISRYD
jgi:polar amino acid transport system substrate-binding protein